MSDGIACQAYVYTPTLLNSYTPKKRMNIERSDLKRYGKRENQQ